MARTCGTISCYNAGCRCPECRRAGREHRYRYRTPVSQRLRTQMCVLCGEVFVSVANHDRHCGAL